MGFLRHHRQKVIDVVRSGKRQILSLHEKVITIRISPTRIKAFIFEHHRPIFGAMLLLVIFISSLFFSQTKANIASFYPNRCLGGWQNATNAEGEPSLVVAAEPEEFTSENSAVLDNNQAELYCGDFAGVIPQDSLPRRFTLRVSWLVKDKDAEPQSQFPSIDTPSEQTDSDKNSEIQTQTENPESETQPLTDPLPEPPPEIEPSPSPEPAKTSEPIEPTQSPQNPEPTPAPQSEDISFGWRKLFRVVKAQEADPASSPSQEPAPANEPVQSIDSPQNPEPSPEPQPETEPSPSSKPETKTDTKPKENKKSEPTETEGDQISADESDATLGTGEAAENEGEQTPSDDTQALPMVAAPSEHGPTLDEQKDESSFMAISYTLDGTTWQLLANVSRADWDKESYEFTSDLVNWEDAAKIQVRFSPIVTIDEPPTVYLDSVYIEVEYDEVVVERENAEGEVPTVKITDPDVVIVTGTETYSSDQTPQFTIEGDVFSINELYEMVDEGKAQVVDDGKKPPNDPTGEAKESLDTIKEILEPTLNELPLSQNKKIKENDPSIESEKPSEGSEPITPPPVNENWNGGSIIQTEVISKSAFLPTDLLSKGLSEPPIFFSEFRPVLITKSVLKPGSKPECQKLRCNQDKAQILGIFSPKVAQAATIKSRKIDAVVIDADSGVTDIKAKVTTVIRNGVPQQSVTIERPREFRPGKFTLRLTIYGTNANIVTEKDFSWGVLAINIDRSIQRPGDSAYLQMGVLNERGHTICNADLDLEITGPTGQKYNFSTDNQTIIRENQCGPNNVISVPDYYAYFAVPGDLGRYQMVLTAETINGIKTITDYFSVATDAPFDVLRTGPTRIFPGAQYPNTMTVTSVEDWSGTVTEAVPASFQIFTEDGTEPFREVVERDGVKIISWYASFKAGEPKTLGYRFKAPDISPEFYLVGPLTFIGWGGAPFSEAREWQIASDGVNLYWVGGTASWDGTAGTKWASSSGGAGGQPVPTSVDNVFFDGNSGAGTVTIASGNGGVHDIDFTGFTGTLAGSAAISISGSLILDAVMGRTYTGAITFTSTSSENITFDAETLNSDLIFNGVGGSWTLQDNANITAKAITITNGSLDTNGKTVTAGSVNSDNSNTRALSLGASSLTLSVSQCWNMTTSTGMTLNAGTSTISCGSTAHVFRGGGLTYYNLTYHSNSTGVSLIYGNNTFNNLTFTAAANASAGIWFDDAVSTTINGTFSVTGNSAINRLMVRPLTSRYGNTITINAANISLTNVDFMDINADGAAIPWTGTVVGDGGGNSDITATTAVTRYWVDTNGGSWNTTASWSSSSGGASGASVPLPQDTVIFDANSITVGSSTITANVQRLGKDIDMSALANSPTFTIGNIPNGTFIFGSLTMPSGTLNWGTCTNGMVFLGHGTHTITSNSKTTNCATHIQAATGTYTLQDAFATTGNAFHLFSGTFDANDQNISSTLYNSSYSNTRTINMGSGTWTATSTGTVWEFTLTTNMTLNAETSTVKLTNASATAKTFAGGGMEYNIVWFAAGTGTGSYTISGNNTFAELKDDGTAAHSLLFTTNSAQTITTWSISGSSGNLKTINSTTTGTHRLIKAGGGVVSADYLNIQHSVATPSTVWYAGNNSVNNQAVATAGSGWIFTAAPSECVATSTGTWGGTDTANFTGCTGSASGGSGTGNRPGAGDNVVINSGVTITLGTNTAALESLAVNGTLDTSGSNYSITTKNLYINNGGTLSANGSNVTLNGIDGVQITRNSGGTFNAGTSTVIVTGDVHFSNPSYLTSGTFTGSNKFNNVTFSPTLSTSRGYVFGSGSIEIGGNFVSTPNGGGSARFLTTTLGSGGLTVTGAITLTGTNVGRSTLDTSSSGSYNLSFGSITIDNTNTLTTYSSNVSITGTTGTLVTNTGTWTTPAGGTVTLSGNGSATISTGAISFYNLTSSGTGTKTTVASATTTVANTFSITGGTFALGSSSTLSLTGTTGTPFATPTGGGTLSAGTDSIVSYSGNNGSGNTTVETGVTYYNLTLNNSSETYALNGALTGNAGGTLTVTDGTLTTTGSNYAISFGKLSIANSGTAVVTANGSTISLSATSGTLFTRGSSGTYTANTSTINLTGNGSATVNSGSLSLYNLTSSGTGTKSVSGSSSHDITLATGGTFTVSAGTFDAGTASTVTSGGTNTLTVSGATIACPRNTTTAFTDCYVGFDTTNLNSGSTVEYNGSGAQSIENTLSYFNLTTSNGGTKSLKGSTSASGTTTIGSGTTLDAVSGSNYALGTAYLSLAGTYTPQASTVTLTGTSGTLFTRTGTFTQGTSEVVVTSGTGTPTLLSAGTTFHKLTINANANVINAGAVITMSSADSANKLYIQTGALNDEGNIIVGTSNGTLEVANGATLCIGGSTGAATATCNSGTTAASASAFPSNYIGDNITLGATSTVIYLSNANQTVSRVPTYGHLKLTPIMSAGRTYTFGSGSTVINGDLTIDPTASLSFTLSVRTGGNITVSSSKTITITKTTSADSVFEINNSDDVSAGNIVIASGGSISTSTGTEITVSGNWTKVGAANLSGSEVIFNSSNTSVITGNTDFHDLTIENSGTKTVQFGAGDRFTVSNSFLAVGVDAGNLITLKSNDDGNKFLFTSTGTANVQYTEIRDAGCQGDTNIIQVFFSNNLSNNDYCWAFVTAMSFSISDHQVGFGTMIPGETRFATSDGNGIDNIETAHTLSAITSAPSGYAVTVFGATLTRNGGVQTISAVSAETAQEANPGSEQFGINGAVETGSGSISDLFSNDTLFAFPRDVPLLFASAVDTEETIYNVRYMANITSQTDAGEYSANITYIMTSEF